MEWLLTNPIADMYGPYFLVLYAGVSALTLASAWIALRRGDWTAGMPLPPVPSAPDPYEIAYLRGGEAEVARAAVFALAQRGLLRTTELGDDTVIERMPEQTDARRLPQMERHVLEWFSRPRRASEAFSHNGLPSVIKGGCFAYEQKLQREHLLTPSDAERQRQRVLLAGSLVIAGLGGYKLFVALSKGRTNVLFLVLLGAVSLIALVIVCRTRKGRLSRRGEAYLERLQMAYARLKYSLPTTSPASAAVAPHAEAATTAAAAFDPSLMLLVGVFGVSALAGTAYDDYQRKLFGSQSYAEGGYGSTGGTGGNGGSSGATCGGDSGGGDSGGGGGGDGGGGGCGGGGCGGCGGS